MSGPPWSALKAQRNMVAGQLKTIANEKAVQNDERNKCRRNRRSLQKTLATPRRWRSRLGSAAPHPVGPKRVRELDLLTREALLEELFARKARIDHIGIERVLLELSARWSAPFAVASSEEGKVVGRLAGNAILGWLAQFATKEGRPAGARRALPWREEVVRTDLKERQRLAKAALRALPEKPHKWAQLRGWDLARAERDVIERFLYSHHLSSLGRFRRVAEIIRVEGTAPKTAYTPAHYLQCWRYAIDQLVKDLSARYGAEELS